MLQLVCRLCIVDQLTLTWYPPRRLSCTSLAFTNTYQSSCKAMHLEKKDQDRGKS